MTKSDIRKKIKSERQKMVPKTVEDLSTIIQSKLIKSKFWPKNGNIALYAHIKNEVATHILFQTALESGLHVFFPRVEQGIEFYEVNGPEDLQKGCWGIPEPKMHCAPLGQDESFNLVVCPGVAFTRDCYRIGYGSGFYDKLLTEQEILGAIVGIAYDFQVIESFPKDQWDKPITAVLTEKQFYFNES